MVAGSSLDHFANVMAVDPCAAAGRRNAGRCVRIRKAAPSDSGQRTDARLKVFFKPDKEPSPCLRVPVNTSDILPKALRASRISPELL